MLLDTGAMYRAVTLAALERGVDVADADALGELAGQVKISFGLAGDGTQTVALDGRDVTAEIRTPEIDRNVSAISAVPAVRAAMVALQRELAEGADVVAEGRDIGTVVFPDAEVKIFLTADPARRAHRRAAQRNLEGAEAEQEILEDLRRRDEADSSRATSPLVAAPDAHHMDSTDMTIDEEVAAISALIALARVGASVASRADATATDATVAMDAMDAQGAAEPTDAHGDGSGEDPSAAAPDAPSMAAEDAEEPAAEDGGATAKDAKAESHDVPGLGPEPSPETEAAPKAKAQAEPKAKDGAKAAAKEGPLHVFGGNTHDDYYDHPIYEFPVTSRCLLGAAVIVCATIAKVAWPWELEDGEYIWEADGGQMIVMNHVSMVDPVLIVVSDWFHGRRVRPIYKSDFDKNRFVTWLCSRIGAIPVDRGKADLKAVRRAQRALMRGEDVLVFPEGTRIHSDDQEVEIHGGFAVMAQLAKAPVVPVAIVGARDATPGGNGRLKPHRIHLKAGRPITFDEVGGTTRKQKAKAMEETAMNAVYRLVDELRERYPKWR